MAELLQVDFYHVLNGVPVTAGQGWAHPGLIEVDIPGALVQSPKLYVFQQAKSLCVHKGGVLESGNLEQPDSEGPYGRPYESARGEGDTGRGLGKAKG